MATFADSFGNMQVAGQVVRIELLVVDPAQPPAEGQGPRLVSGGQLAVPLEGFVRSFGLMSQMMRRMEEAGIVRRNPPPNRAQPVAAEPAPAVITTG
jgi:hypothetical protein